MLGWRLPSRPGATPPATHALPWLSSVVSAESMRDTSTWRPQPVGALAEGARQRPVALVGQVEHDGALVAVEAQVVGAGLAAPRRPPRARVVARARSLHLDDVR